MTYLDALVGITSDDEAAIQTDVHGAHLATKVAVGGLEKERALHQFVVTHLSSGACGDDLLIAGGVEDGRVEHCEVRFHADPRHPSAVDGMVS